MTEAEKRKRDIRGKLDSIRLAWRQAAETLDQTELAKIRDEIASHYADLKELFSN